MSSCLKHLLVNYLILIKYRYPAELICLCFVLCTRVPFHTVQRRAIECMHTYIYICASIYLPSYYIKSMAPHVWLPLCLDNQDMWRGPWNNKNSKCHAWIKRMHDDHAWRPCMTIMHDDHAWRSCMWSPTAQVDLWISRCTGRLWWAPFIHPVCFRVRWHSNVLVKGRMQPGRRKTSHVCGGRWKTSHVCGGRWKSAMC